MKLVVLGATGGTGLQIVKSAIARGHEITALVRSPEKLNGVRDFIHVRQGSPLSSEELAAAIQGHEAVISGFGPRVPIAKSEAHLLEDFAVALTAAMKKTGVTRAVLESVAFLFQDSIVPPAYLLGRLFFGSVVADATAMERIFATSGLDWTIVRPPELTDKPFTGKYRVREGHLPRFGFKISRADVADYMVKAVEDSSTSRKVIGVSN